MKILRLIPLPNESQNGETVRKCRVERISGSSVETSDELWFQFPESIKSPNEDDCDSYLLAMLFDAMLEGRALEVQGKASRRLLSNLQEFQLAWNGWLPELFSPVEFHSIEIDDSFEKAAGAVCLFSGGVDATFSVWRHSKGKAGYRNCDLSFGSMVHGFDIPINETSAFESARIRSEQTLASVGLGLVSIATNYREIARAPWLYAHAAALVGAMTNFKKEVGMGIIGSSEPYNDLTIPWGSSPIGDPLLGGQNFEVIHDGATHNRTQKVAEIAEWDIGIENLRVCWQGDLKDRNCGKCEKCLRTRLNFLANGCAEPSCFPESALMNDLKELGKIKESMKTEWQQIHEQAILNGINDEWVRKLPRMYNGLTPAFIKAAVEQLLPRGCAKRKRLKKALEVFRFGSSATSD